MVEEFEDDSWARIASKLPGQREFNWGGDAEMSERTPDVHASSVAEAEPVTPAPGATEPIAVEQVTLEEPKKKKGKKSKDKKKESANKEKKKVKAEKKANKSPRKAVKDDSDATDAEIQTVEDSITEPSLAVDEVVIEDGLVAAVPVAAVPVERLETEIAVVVEPELTVASLPDAGDSIPVTEADKPPRKVAGVRKSRKPLEVAVEVQDVVVEIPAAEQQISPPVLQRRENPDRDYSDSMEYLNLKWGAKLAKVGFGFWKVEKQETARICRQAIEVGYRHLDCACDYGNEVEVGQGIASAIRDGIVEREDLWVTSKLWNTFHAAEHVRPALERSLQDLGLDYIDLYLIHFPLATKYVSFEKRYPPGWFTDPNATRPLVEEVRVPIRETWQALEELAKSGLIKQIGVCNFGTSLLRDLLSYAHIRPTVLQVETHPYLSQPKLLRYCQQERIAYTAFSPLGAQSYFSLGMADPSEAVLVNPVVTAIAGDVGKSPAQVVLRWGIQRGTAVIPKTSTRERMLENINIFDFELSQSQMAAIDALDQGRRFNDPGNFGEAAFNTYLPIYE